ncbi:C4b-binding protein alpha chain [Myotis brandtii]|uniref:C4b-binding protein alpha chain n=1 Tax=Myotis brandtii TaxID=109478 RepID=S7NS32_MYOBR|nr:C4b-binding protein alpha chain [Myotis brandtii]
MPPKLQSILPALYLLGVLTLLLCPSGLCDCRIPPGIAHGSHHDISSFLSFTTVVHYECDEGYVLVGDPQITCRSSQWSSPAPQCKALCLKPEVENGKLSEDKDLFIESENVTIQCDSGYGVVNSQNITCSTNRTWYPEVPKCEWNITCSTNRTWYPEVPKCEWEVHNGCEQVVEGSKLMQCLPSPMDVKMALEVYKLSLEIKRLKQE